MEFQSACTIRGLLGRGMVTTNERPNLWYCRLTEAIWAGLFEVHEARSLRRFVEEYGVSYEAARGSLRSRSETRKY